MLAIAFEKKDNRADPLRALRSLFAGGVLAHCQLRSSNYNRLHDSVSLNSNFSLLVYLPPSYTSFAVIRVV